MKTLAEELLALLPGNSNGIPLKQACELLAADRASVRLAFLSLEEAGRAKLCRRGTGRGFYLLPLDYPGRICIICKREWVPTYKYSKARTCSHSCGRHLAWQNDEMRERHRASVKASRSMPSVKQAAEKRAAQCKTPEARAQRAEQNRKSWADPESRARRLNSIDKAWQVQERRDRQRKKKLRLWNDPEWRAKNVAAMRTGKRGRFKRAILALAIAHPHMTPHEIAERVGRTLEQVRIVMQRARCLGELGPRPGDSAKLRKRYERMQRKFTAPSSMEARP